MEQEEKQGTFFVSLSHMFSAPLLVTDITMRKTSARHGP